MHALSKPLSSTCSSQYFSSNLPSCVIVLVVFNQSLENKPLLSNYHTYIRLPTIIRRYMWVIHSCSREIISNDFNSLGLSLIWDVKLKKSTNFKLVPCHQQSIRWSRLCSFNCVTVLSFIPPHLERKRKAIIATQSKIVTQHETTCVFYFLGTKLLVMHSSTDCNWQTDWLTN